MYFDHDVRFSWSWTILLHKKYYFCNPCIFCILVLKFIVFRVPDSSFASFCDLGAPFWNVSGSVFGSFPTYLTDPAYVTDPTYQTYATDLTNAMYPNLIICQTSPTYPDDNVSN